MAKDKIKRRNPVAHTAILRKGGVHEKSRSAGRQKQKGKVKKAVTDYMNDKQYGSEKTWFTGKNRKGGEEPPPPTYILNNTLALQL